MTKPPIHAGSFSIPADHPCLPGHMPGHPIVPGALLLDRAIEVIGALPFAPSRPGPMTVKFPGTVEPGDVVTIDCDSPRAGTIVFRGHVGTRLVLSGRLGIQA